MALLDRFADSLIWKSIRKWTRSCTGDFGQMCLHVYVEINKEMESELQWHIWTDLFTFHIKINEYMDMELQWLFYIDLLEIVYGNQGGHVIGAPVVLLDRFAYILIFRAWIGSSSGSFGQICLQFCMEINKERDSELLWEFRTDALTGLNRNH